VAVVDHQRRAALMHQPPAERERKIVGAPFVDRADRHVPHAGGTSCSNSGITSLAIERQISIRPISTTRCTSR
jgi:hypothetical protein